MKSGEMQITLLGTGCSTGVPRVDGYWGACDPKNPKNRRLRCSAFLKIAREDGQKPIHILIDTSPDLRQQAMQNDIFSLDAVFWTHDHADQTHGIDDLRAFCFDNGALDGFMDKATFETLEQRFHYIIHGGHNYPALVRPRVFEKIGGDHRCRIKDFYLEFQTFNQIHGPINSVGYRFGDFAYSSDVSDIPDDAWPLLNGLKVWVVDALRYKPHPTHAHLDRTLGWIERVKPELAILTNLHQDMDFEALKAVLPNRVVVGYDGFNVLI